jgi:hypothetical protein
MDTTDSQSDACERCTDIVCYPCMPCLAHPLCDRCAVAVSGVLDNVAMGLLFLFCMGGDSESDDS